MQEHTTPCTLVPMAYKSVASATFLCHIWADHGWVDTLSHTLVTAWASYLTIVILQLNWISDGVIASQCLMYSTCILLLDAVKWLTLVIQYQAPTSNIFVYLCSVLMVSKSMEQWDYLYKLFQGTRCIVCQSMFAVQLQNKQQKCSR